MRAVSVGATVVLVMMLGLTGAAGAVTLSGLDLVHNPSGRVPLGAQLTFSTDVPVVTTLHISDGENESEVVQNEAYATEHDLMVLGMRADRTHTIRVTVRDRNGSEATSEAMSITTDALPEDFPPIDLKISRPRRMEPGYTLVPLFKWGGAGPDQKFGLVLGLDAHAEVVWYYLADHTIGDLIPTDRGTFTYQVERNGRMKEIDMLGNVLNEWHTTPIPKEVSETSIPVDTDLFHHDHQVLENGNFFMLSTEVREFKAYPSSETDPEREPRDANVIGDVIVEFTREGEIVQEHKIFDLFNPYRIGYGSLGTGFYAQSYKDVLERAAKDWSHTNSIFYDAPNNAAVLSSYHLDFVYKIDLESGELVWLLGNHEGWDEPWQKYLLTPKGENFRWNWHQHSAKVTPHGTIIVFDNGTYQARPFEEKQKAEDSYSRAVEFAIDEEKMEVRQVWSYGGPTDEIFFSPFISEVDWLPTKGNILITDGGAVRNKDGSVSSNIFGGHHFARVLEVTHEMPASKVFEIVIDDPEMGWAVYRSERISSLYR